ncbi:PAS domain-containing protein [Candidatus Roizmanbacteria bacterium]|nr:PAS domain-containing protein [Candidatus Roizmanbacteria bacterium]
MKLLLRLILLLISFTVFLTISFLFYPVFGDVIFLFSGIIAVAGGLIFGPLGGLIGGLLSSPSVSLVLLFFGQFNFQKQLMIAIPSTLGFSFIGILVGRMKKVQDSLQGEKTIELKLLEAEQRFTAFMDNIPNIAWIKDPTTWEHIYVNKSFENFFKKTLKEMEGKTDFDIWTKEIAGDLRKHDKEVLENKTSIKVYEQVPDSKGVIHHWLVYKFPLILKTKILIAGIATDITDQKKYENDLVQKTLELEKMNKLMVGRELKMSELKKEIERLRGGENNE